MKASNYPFFAQFSDEQIKAQYKKNIAGLTQMLDKATRTGKKVNNYTAAQLRELVVNTERQLA